MYCTANSVVMQFCVNLSCFVWYIKLILSCIKYTITEKTNSEILGHREGFIELHTILIYA